MLHRDHEHRAFSLRMWLLPLLSYYHCVYTFQLHFSYISVILKLHTFTPFKYCTPWDCHQTLRRRDNEQVDIPYWNVIENNVSVNASDFKIIPCNLDLNSVSFHFSCNVILEMGIYHIFFRLRHTGDSSVRSTS